MVGFFLSKLNDPYLPDIAYCIFLCIDFCTKAPSPASGLHHRVWKRRRNFIIMQIWLRGWLLSCHDLLAFFLQKNETARMKEKDTLISKSHTSNATAVMHNSLVKCNYWFHRHHWDYCMHSTEYSKGKVSCFKFCSWWFLIDNCWCQTDKSLNMSEKWKRDVQMI